jgi:hypothetical protein
LPSGARNVEGVKKLAADALTHVMGTFRQAPGHKTIQREIVRRSLLYNICFVLDEFDETAYPYPKPKTYVISHLDGYVDPAAFLPVNEDDGPRWVTVRRWYYKDQAERRFGATRVKDMKHGPYFDDFPSDSQEAKKLQDKYPVMEWWGIDSSIETIGTQQTKKYVGEIFPGIITGQFGVPQEWENHRAAIKAGDDNLIKYVNEALGPSEDYEEISEVVTALDEAGRFTELQQYYLWRQVHQTYLENGIEGGEIDKFNSHVFKMEFQEGVDEPLTAPKESPYKHGQIPISIFQRHEGTENFWTKGIMAEALTLQSQIEFLDANREVSIILQSQPPLAYNREKMPVRYRDPGLGHQKLTEDLERGHVVLDLSETANPSDLPHFLEMGKYPIDVLRIIAEKKTSLMELFGAPEVMRGIGPGSEASGKHIQLKMEAATRPSTFMLQLIEGPLHKYFERQVSNVLYMAKPEWLEQICSPEQVQAIMTAREAPDFHSIVKVGLGSGMPTDWPSRMQIYGMVMETGAVDPFMFMEEMGIPIPSGAREQYEMQKQMMAAAAGPGNPTQGKMSQMRPGSQGADNTPNRGSA